MNRRRFLRNAGAAGLAGAGLIGASGTASAGSPYELPTDLHGSFTHGNASSDQSATFRCLVPDTYLDLPFDGYIEHEYDHSDAVLDELVSQSAWLEGVTVHFYEYSYGWFEDYDGHTGIGEVSDAVFQPTLDTLDDALNSTWFSDNATYVWDVGEVHQDETDDWDGSPGSEHHDGPRTDPANSSDTFYPTVADDVSGDGHSNDYAHARVRIGDFMIGRVTSMLIHTLIRSRDDGHWNTFDDPPGTDIYDPDRDWELAEGVFVEDGGIIGSDVYTTSAAGKTTVTAMEDIFDSSFCRGDDPGSDDWVGPSRSDGMAEEVSFCTSDMVSQAVQYFD